MRILRAFVMTLLMLPWLLCADDKQITIGLIPSEDSQAMIESSQQVIDQLEKKLGVPVKPFVATDYNGIIEALRSKKLDVAYLGPFSYALASSVANAEAFAVAVTKKTGGSSYHSVIIAHKDSGLKSIQDLKDHTFSFVDPSSTSGHLFPKAGLMKLGIDPDKYFSRLLFSGSHDASILSVANKKVDAAAVADRILASAIARGIVQESDFVILWKSNAIPESPMVWRRDLSPELKGKLAKAFSEIKGLPWGDQGVLNGFQKTTDQAYDIIRETAKILDLDLKGMK